MAKSDRSQPLFPFEASGSEQGPEGGERASGERQVQSRAGQGECENDGAATEMSSREAAGFRTEHELIDPAERAERARALLAGRTVYVVDGHSLVFQVFHALPEMAGPHGQPVGAVFGFARDLFALIDKKRPDFLFCAFDVGDVTFRHELFEAYKGQRAEMPDSLRAQMPIIDQLLEAMGIPILRVVGHEADDVLATVARQVAEAGGECFLVTADKDCRQLIGPGVWVYNIRKDQVIGADEVRQQWGIDPSQVVDFQALVGDAVDNVPGVPLIGPKIAGQLLAQYGTLEGIYEHLDEIPGAKRRENLARYRDQALVSRTLVRLVDDLPLELDWEAGRVGQWDVQRLLAMLRELGFRGLSARVLELSRAAEVPADGSEDADATSAPAGRPAREYVLVDTWQRLEELVGELEKLKSFAVDTETTDVRPRWSQLVGFSVSWEPHRAYYVPLMAPPGQPKLDWPRVRERIRGVLEDPATSKRGQNLKYDLIALRTAGVTMRGIAFDTMVASYDLDAGQQIHSLADLSKRYLDVVPIPISDLIGKGKADRLDQVDVARVCEYAAEDADLAWQLSEVLAERLRQEGMERLFYELEMPLVEILADLEYTGMAVDRAKLAELDKRFGEQLEVLEAEVHALAGHPFNLASPRQLAEVLFGELNLPVVKKTKTGPSTDAEVLEQLAVLHPLPARLMEHRHLAKLKGTYVDALPQMIHPGTGRIHTSLNQVVTATGRLSSNDPNLQNIPIRSEAGREIREAFIPGDPGERLLRADYSQIELRVLAHFSEDPVLLDAFAQDADIHAQVASEVYRVPLEQVTPSMRRSAKAINFGIVYGQSPFGLARNLSIDQDEAAAYIDAYFTRHPGVEEFIENVLDQCAKNGYVTSIFGRRRRIIGVRDPARRGSSRQRTLPERTAINTVIQGSAADLIKKAMIQVHGRIRHESIPARMLLQIHDELVFEVEASAVDRLAHLVCEEMANVMELKVPLRVDVKVGSNWAQGERWSAGADGRRAESAL